jgi:hypothetical protein
MPELLVHCGERRADDRERRGEDGWSLFRTGGEPDASSRERRNPASAERKAESCVRPQKATTDARLSDVGISCDQTSRWQELAAIPEEIFEHEIMNRLAGCGLARCRPGIADLPYPLD